MNNYKKIVRDIKNLKIQGATNVAKASINALLQIASLSKSRTKTKFLNELDSARAQLCSTRSTEPLMRNALRYIFFNVRDSAIENIEDLKKLVSVVAEDVMKNIASNKEKIAEFISKKIEENDVIFTHCHSSSVTGGLIMAWNSGKKFSVICTETRPLFQGRRTAKELVEAGIPVTMVVDSAIHSFIKEANFVLVGCDMITADINIMNKIGTLGLAIAAKRSDIPLYVCTELGKFDPETMYGKAGEVEQRPPEEVWNCAPPGLVIKNPAFDVTSKEIITAFITQEGIISPEQILDTIKDKAQWVLYGVKP